MKRHPQMLEILRSTIGPTEVQPGCIRCGLLVEDSAECATVLSEQWESEEALEEHVCSDAFRRVLAAFELCTQPPEVRIQHASESRGMELIERWRARSQSVGQQARCTYGPLARARSTF